MILADSPAPGVQRVKIIDELPGEALVELDHLLTASESGAIAVDLTRSPGWLTLGGVRVLTRHARRIAEDRGRRIAGPRGRVRIAAGRDELEARRLLEVVGVAGLFDLHARAEDLLAEAWS